MSNENPAGNESTGMDVAQIRQVVQDEVGQLIEVRSDAENPGLEDVWVAGQPLGKIIESNRETAKSAEKLAHEARSSKDEPHPEGKETTLHRPEMTPIDRLAEAEDREDVTMGHVTESVERATVIYKHFREWSQKAPKGRVIKSNLKNLLSTATGERLAWKQVYRACRKVVEWSKGAYTFKKTRRHGWILIEERASSVSTGG